MVTLHDIHRKSQQNHHPTRPSREVPKVWAGFRSKHRGLGATEGPKTSGVWPRVQPESQGSMVLR